MAKQKKVWVIWTDCGYRKVKCVCTSREAAIKAIRAIADSDEFAQFMVDKLGIDPRRFDAADQEASEDFKPSDKDFLGFWCDAACFIEGGRFPISSL